MSEIVSMSEENVFVRRMRERILRDKEDSSSSYFNALLIGCEFVTKLTTAMLIGAINDDKDNSRYALEHELVRADGIGSWVDVLQKLYTGPSVISLDEQAKRFVQEITQRVTASDWRYCAYDRMKTALAALRITPSDMDGAVKMIKWFSAFVQLRNKTRGHGATLPGVMENACEPLAESLFLILDNFSLLKCPCAYLRRNLSRKYRVSKISGDISGFEKIKSETSHNLPDGLYIGLSSFHRCALLESDPDLTDLFVPNGGFNSKTYEVLSPITGNTNVISTTPFLKPVQRLPGSATDGLAELDVIGDVFSNLPVPQSGYVSRHDLEKVLLSELKQTDRHPIVTLNGRGGIGKTSLALQVITNLANDASCPYEHILWFSARDIDLLPDRAVDVRPDGLSLSDFAIRFTSLMGLPTKGGCNKDAEELFAKGLSSCISRPTLFIFDNFETVVSKTDMYKWIETYVRNPNKVLITTRERRFCADYPILVEGMTDEECGILIQQTVQRLRMPALSSSLQEQLISESGGHPYIIKIMLGEMSRFPNKRNVERVIAARTDILDALFERTYSKLSREARHVFLVLSGWRSLIPELALEAVLIRPSHELLDTRQAIEELTDYSFIESVESSSSEVFLSVPLAAQIFGQCKLRNYPSRGTIMEDIHLLQQFGVTTKNNLEASIEKRLRTLFTNIDKCVKTKEKPLEFFRPIVEYVARKMPKAWNLLADICQDTNEEWSEYLEKYLHSSSGADDVEGWKKLQRFYSATGRVADEINSLTQLARAATATIHDVSYAAQRMNLLIYDNKGLLEQDDRRQWIRELVSVMSRRQKECSATDLSRLAWLYMNLGEVATAETIVSTALRLEPDNDYCLSLRERIGKSKY